ncbi:B3 domain-containing protein [Cardamine amara subsp. amara]|uniref:B3 domain-containing protein n=1 Tax=Cardamine amara subsp. amara TaxID=228776 RepID=A0ABD1B1A8_CARAN
MPKTTFYTFLQTKHQEQNVDPTDANYPLFPQEVEIRPITPFPWKILKTLTIDDLRDEAKFHIPLAQVEDNVLGTLSQDDLRRANLVIREVQTKVKDLDTNTVHDVKLWKYPHEDNFNMRRCWIERFVKRRGLIVGMMVGIYWSVEDKMFHFSVLE